MARNKRSASIDLQRQQYSTLDENGSEIPDPVPFQPALKMRREPSLAERIKAMVRSEHWARQMEEAGEETFDDADDFDVGDDFDPQSPYEEMFEGEFDYHREQRLEARTERSQRSKKKKPAPEKTEVRENKPEEGGQTPPKGAPTRDDHS